jgi:hypothetical protein
MRPEDSTPSDVELLGIKRLSRDNWRDIDPTNAVFGWMPDPDAVVEQVMSPRLSRHVPAQIVRLFEVARSAMCYGFVFNPIWTLAAEQLFRVADTALAVRCKELGGTTARTFAERITFISERLPASSQSFDWHTLRRLRNDGSHPAEQMIVSPGMAVPVVEKLANAINELFAGA